MWQKPVQKMIRGITNNLRVTTLNLKFILRTFNFLPYIQSMVPQKSQGKKMSEWGKGQTSEFKVRFEIQFLILRKCKVCVIDTVWKWEEKVSSENWESEFLRTKSQIFTLCYFFVPCISASLFLSLFFCLFTLYFLNIWHCSLYGFFFR